MRRVQQAGPSRAAAAAVTEFGEQFELYLLDFHQAFPLPREQVIHLFMQVTTFKFGLEIDLVVMLTAQSVLGVLAVLTHRDDWRLHCSEAGQDQVKQDVGEGVERAGNQRNAVDSDPDA